VEVTNAKQNVEKCMKDVDLDSATRSHLILTTTDDVFKRNVPLALITLPNVGMSSDDGLKKQYFDSFTIDDCNKLAPPVLIVGDVSFREAEVYWKGEYEYIQDAKEKLDSSPTEFEIAYARYVKRKKPKIADKKKPKKK